VGFGGSFPVSTAALVLGAALVALPPAAHAAVSFPGAIQEYLDQTGDVPKCPVPCTLCHTREEGGRDFMKDEGFILNLNTQMTPLDETDPASLKFALQGLATRPCRGGAEGTICDSDSDGMPDIEELRRGRDPDGSRDFATCIQYGCGATIAPQRPERTELGPLWLVAAFAAVAAARRARR
jgi:hypothetical protein